MRTTQLCVGERPSRHKTRTSLAAEALRHPLTHASPTAAPCRNRDTLLRILRAAEIDSQLPLSRARARRLARKHFRPTRQALSRRLRPAKASAPLPAGCRAALLQQGSPERPHPANANRSDAARSPSASVRRHGGREDGDAARGAAVRRHRLRRVGFHGPPCGGAPRS
eukprot:361929-Chlamydomonas_euryale.AAC.5